MPDYEKIVHGLIDPIVENKDAIMVREIPGRSPRDINLIIVSEDRDTARLIGRKGSVANALREAIGIAAKAENSNVRVHLKFESFDEKSSDEGESTSFVDEVILEESEAEGE